MASVTHYAQNNVGIIGRCLIINLCLVCGHLVEGLNDSDVRSQICENLIITYAKQETYICICA